MTISDDQLQKPFLYTIRSSKLFTCIVVNLAIFTDGYLYGLIIPVLPFALVERVDLKETEVQRWIGILLAVYGGGLIIGSPIAGLIADSGISRRGPYLAGLIALALSTLAFSIGRTTWILLIGRAIQGLSSAIVHTVGCAILADTVGEEGIGPAMGFVTMSIALGVVMGPMLGGIIYHTWGYIWVFVSGYVLVGLDFVLRVGMLEVSGGHSEGNAGEEAGVDKRLVAGHGTDRLSYGTIDHQAGGPQQKTPNTDSPESYNVITPLLSSPCDSPLTSYSSSSSSSIPTKSGLLPAESPAEEASIRHPLLTLLASPRMLATILGDFSNSVILTCLETILPLRIKTLFGYNSMQVALIFLTISLPSFLGPLIGHLSDIHGARLVISTGFTFTIPLLLLLTEISGPVDIGNPGPLVALLCLLLFSLGITLNMILTPVFAEVMYVVDDLDFHPTSAITDTASTNSTSNHTTSDHTNHCTHKTINNTTSTKHTTTSNSSAPESASANHSKKTPPLSPKKPYAQAFSLTNIAYALGSLLGPLLGGLGIELLGWQGVCLTLAIGAIVCGALIFIGLGRGRRNEGELGERHGVE